jgi:prepilin-type N-terminal cleavage/methylation domain-containing protein
MEAGKGFTLVEIIVTMVIVGIAAAFAIPNLITSIEQTNAQGAKNNLLAIAAKQSKYFEDQTPNAYCTGAPNCDTAPHIDTSLQLGIADSFTYSCSATGQTIPYNCTASDATVTLLLDPNNPPTNCPGSVGGPVCCTAGGASCPS